MLNSADQRRYVMGWKRAADDGVVAVGPDGVPVGAAWYRVLPQNEPGLGFVGVVVPELILGVHLLWRARGIGRTLLREIVQLAGRSGLFPHELERRAGQLRPLPVPIGGVQRVGAGSAS